MSEHLKELEERSIYVIREANAKFKNLAALWSTGKDSTVLVALARKAFLRRSALSAHPHRQRHRLSRDLRAARAARPRSGTSTSSRCKSIIKDDISGIRCCGANKTDALKKLLDERKFDGLFVSIRRDEHGIRGKERYFSPRDEEFRWDYKNQARRDLGLHLPGGEGLAHPRSIPCCTGPSSTCGSTSSRRTSR